MWDIEWDYDYGFVLTSTDGGKNFASHPSENGYTTSNTDPPAGNPNQNGCQATYDNGITGTQRSYDGRRRGRSTARPATPRTMVFLADSYDISDAGRRASPVLRFSYATDPGLARPGWFIDDVVDHRDPAGGGTREIYATDFETSGDPEDPRIFNGGCRADGSGASAPRAGSTSRPAPRDPPTTPTTWRCATAPASTSTATARSTATRSAFASGLLHRLHRRGARLRQRRHRRPAGAVPAGQPARAGQRHARPQRRGLDRGRR